jgi:hypothetical protein
MGKAKVRYDGDGKGRLIGVQLWASCSSRAGSPEDAKMSLPGLLDLPPDLKPPDQPSRRYELSSLGIRSLQIPQHLLCSVENTSSPITMKQTPSQPPVRTSIPILITTSPTTDPTIHRHQQNAHMFSFQASPPAYHIPRSGSSSRSSSTRDDHHLTGSILGKPCGISPNTTKPTVSHRLALSPQPHQQGKTLSSSANPHSALFQVVFNPLVLLPSAPPHCAVLCCTSPSPDPEKKLGYSAPTPSRAALQAR